MKKGFPILAVCFLLFALCGCENGVKWRENTPPERQTADLTVQKPPAPAPLPENVVQETFRPAEDLEPLTVTVTYDGENGQNRVEITRDGTVLQSFTEDDEEWRSGWRNVTVEDMNFDGYLDFRFCYATFAGPNYWEHVYLCEYDDLTGEYAFRKAEELDEMCQLAFDGEAEVFCDHSSGMGYVSDTLYKWTEEGCAARRRIEWDFAYERQTTRVTVWDRTPGAPPLPEWDEPEEHWTRLCRWEYTGYAEPGYGTEPDRWYDLDYHGEGL